MSTLMRAVCVALFLSLCAHPVHAQIISGGTSGGGAGTITTTGSPANTYVSLFSGATSITGTSALTASGGSLTGTGTITGAILATSGTATGTVAISGTTSGTVTITTQDAAGTYNLNLPTTAGTSGYQLASGGGGSTAMTWAARPFNCSVGIGVAGAASPALANDNDITAGCTNTTGADVTIATVACASASTTGTPTADVKFSGGASILTGAISCGAAPTYVGGTLSGTPVIHTFSGTGGTCSSTPCALDVDITPGGTTTAIIVKITGTY